MKTLKFSIGALLLCGLVNAQQYTVITVAGQGGSPGNSGDFGPASNAQFTNPIRVAVDNQGNLYITDYSNQLIRRVDHTTGVVTTVAGSGTFGFSNDGMSGAGANIAAPHDVVADNAGNVYIADTLNARVRKLDAAGIISTIAGNGTRGYGGDGGAATDAQLTLPTGLALDSKGNLYIADPGNGSVRKVSPTGMISTVAGKGNVVFGAAPGDGGLAINAFLEMPYAVEVDAAGVLYIGDIGSSSIRRVTNDGKISTYVQNFIAQNFALDSAGAIYFANYRNNTVVKILPGGTQLWIAGNGTAGYSGDGGIATSAQFSQPYGVAVDSSGNVYVADAANAVIRKLTPIPFSIGAVANAASIQGFATPLSGQGDASLPISAGEIVVLFGTGLGPATLQVNSPQNGAFGTQLAGTTVTINGQAAPIIYTSSSIVAAIVPYSVNGRSSVPVSISYQGKVTANRTLPVALTAPGVFTADASGSGQAAAVNQDGTLNGVAHPAPIGSIVAFYLTGEGQTNPAGVDGKLANAAPYPAPLQNVSVTVNGLSASIAYAGAAPTLVAGVMQLNVQIPSGVDPNSAVPVNVSIGGTFSQLVTIAVSAQ
ncbi:MAG: IPT/TIG domain-containing protein [Terriglobia bacterium]